MFDCYLPRSMTAYRLNDTFGTYLKSEKVSVLGHEEVIPVLRYFKRDMRVNSNDKWFSVDCELNQSQSILRFSREEINNSAQSEFVSWVRNPRIDFNSLLKPQFTVGLRQGDQHVAKLFRRDARFFEIFNEIGCKGVVNGSWLVVVDCDHEKDVDSQEDDTENSDDQSCDLPLVNFRVFSLWDWQQFLLFFLVFSFGHRYEV